MRRLAERARPRPGRAIRCTGGIPRVESGNGRRARPLAHAGGVQNAVAALARPERVGAADAPETDDTLERTVPQACYEA